MRELFERRVRELTAFVEEHELGSLEIVQAELNFNAVDLPDGQLGDVEHLLRGWDPPAAHHLGGPEQLGWASSSPSQAWASHQSGCTSTSIPPNGPTAHRPSSSP